MAPVQHLTRRETRQKQVRGFVILVVMLLLAVATAVALNQFTVVSNETVTSVRVEEEIQARATAEGCLALMQSYVVGYIGTSPPGFNQIDFDRLIDRDGVADNGDDFLPSMGTRVLVPKSLTSTPATEAAHQWSFLPRGVLPNQGACLMRVEDNSDDGFPASSVPTGTSGNNTVAEGGGRDVPTRDRDRAIYITVIGLYPLLPGTTGPDAYERAHSRVTLRRLFSTENPVQTPPAVQACGDVALSSNTRIEGLGGVQADNISISGGTTCGCGLYTANTVPATPPTACDANPLNCSPPATSAQTPPPCAGPPTCGPSSPPNSCMPSATYYMDNKGFGDPGKDDNNIGGFITKQPTIKSCKVYIDRNGKVFVWDTTDTYANEPADFDLESADDPMAAFVVPGVGVPTALQTIPNLPRHDCTNYTKDPVELPCTWITANGSEKVTCDFTNANPKLRQTPCWKPIADLSDGTTFGTDVTLKSTGPADKGVPLSGLNSGNHFEMSSNQNSEDLLFIKNKPIPNIRNQAMMFATGDITTTMCGDPNGCSECTGASNNDWWTECEAETKPCSNFHSHSHQNNNHIPWPVVFAWDVDPARQIDFQYDPAGTVPLNVTILASGKIAFVGDIPFCCAECGTGNSCMSTPGAASATAVTVPGQSAKFIAPANCVEGNSQIPNPAFTPPPPVPGPVQFIPSGYGYAFKTDGDCFISGNSTVIGDVECRAVSMPGNACVVGNVMGTGSSTTVGCTGGACSPSGNLANPNVGACITGSPKLLGDLYSQGSVCSTSGGATFHGDIFTNGNVSFASNFILEGQIFANENVSMASNTVIDFQGGGQIISAGNQGLTTFMETSW